MPVSISDVKAAVKGTAEEVGFDLCGVAPVADSPELKHFPAWIAAGRAGEMKYMDARDEKGNLKRASLSRVAPWARSVIVCAINYNTAHPYSTAVKDPERGWISRYAWGREDYHDQGPKTLLNGVQLPGGQSADQELHGIGHGARSTPP